MSIALKSVFTKNSLNRHKNPSGLVVLPIFVAHIDSYQDTGKQTGRAKAGF